MKIKCDLSVRYFVPLLFVSLVALLSLSYSDTSRAISDFDNSIFTTTTLSVGYESNRHDVTPGNADSSYGQIMAEKCPELWDMFNDSVSETGSWAIVQDDRFYRGRAVYIIWENSPNGSTFAPMTMEHQSSTYDRFVFGDTPTQWSAAIYWDNGDFQCTTNAAESIVAIDILRSDPSHFKFFLSTYETIYPEGYQGSEIPQTADSRPIVKPDFTFQVNDKKVTAHDYNQNLPPVTPDEGYTINGYSVEWSLYRCGTDWDDVTKSCSNSSLLNHQILPQDTDYNFTVPEHDDYFIVAQYLVQQCYRYPSYPATPDYCFYVDLGTELPNYDFDSTTIHLPVDGSSFSGDTKDMQCDSSGYCETPQANCDAKPDFIQKLSCQVEQQLKFGVLNPSINAFKSLFTSFTVPPNPTCNIPLGNVALLPGHAFPLSQYSAKACTSAAQFRASFPVAAVALNALIALFTVILLVRTFNKLTDHKDNDLIQGI